MKMCNKKQENKNNEIDELIINKKSVYIIILLLTPLFFGIMSCKTTEITIKKELKKNPNNPKAINDAADFYYKRKQYSEAIKYYQQLEDKNNISDKQQYRLYVCGIQISTVSTKKRYWRYLSPIRNTSVIEYEQIEEFKSLVYQLPKHWNSFNDNKNSSVSFSYDYQGGLDFFIGFSIENPSCIKKDEDNNSRRKIIRGKKSRKKYLFNEQCIINKLTVFYQDDPKKYLNSMEFIIYKKIKKGIVPKIKKIKFTITPLKGLEYNLKKYFNSLFSEQNLNFFSGSFSGIKSLNETRYTFLFKSDNTKNQLYTVFAEYNNTDHQVFYQELERFIQEMYIKETDLKPWIPKEPFDPPSPPRPPF